MAEQEAAPAFLISARYVVDAADIGAFKNVAARMVEHARRRPGCSFLNAAQDVSDPGTFHLTEGWSSEDALNARIGSEEFQAVLGEALRLRIRSRSGTMFFVSGKQDLEMPA